MVAKGVMVFDDTSRYGVVTEVCVQLKQNLSATCIQTSVARRLKARKSSPFLNMSARTALPGFHLLAATAMVEVLTYESCFQRQGTRPGQTTVDARQLEPRFRNRLS
jgi:hypothetical protein